ncbi:transketolase C-terminal domain-containing protein [Hymenobacter sp. BT770]|uniref:transketolase family protein n=1 Tax=Hymenobacter sp. BT770 TaxID=2886942 RepID=UPI001D125FC8|nr:transketolase C-terminal domain-containing protein [Hymenobacter sp. BT770]MCC3153180.1 transketolase [Hymenobacter sp. BT770]MDO3415346.1 transketolase C-terminal domain-containing protein [Hymenobacter sp. BT770]
MTYEELIKQTALADDRLVVMTAENRALIRNLPAVLGPRFIDTGITEQTLIGAAAGLALRGRIPVVHALATFLTLRAFEFVRTDVGIAGLPVKLSGFVPGFLSDGNGPTHQAIEDVSLMRGIPGMTVFAPADEADMLAMLPAIWASPAPAYVRINTRPATYEHAPFEMGKAEIVAEGTDITILTYGMLFEQTLVARELLQAQGKSVGLINLRSLKPVDEAALLEVARRGSLIVTVEDHFITGGLYSILAEVLLRNQLTARVLPLALEERWYRPGRLSAVLEHEGFTGQHIAQRIATALGENGSTISAGPAVLENQFAE